MEDCIFCKIIAGTIPSTKVYEDELVYAFRDISPQAPTHILVVPKEHTPDVLACAKRGDALLGAVMAAAARIAEAEGLAASGFRLVTNLGEHGAQSVRHFHVHILGGRQLTGQMG